MQEEKRKYVVPGIVLDEDKRAILRHQDYKLPDSLLKEPLRNKYTIGALDVDSFIDLVNEYKEPNSKLFFDDKSIKCVVDFNSKDKAEFCEKRINLGLGVTPFFKAFEESVGKNLGQRDFVFLLKSLFAYITAIDGKPNDNMDVIELAESLQAVKKFDSVQKKRKFKNQPRRRDQIGRKRDYPDAKKHHFHATCLRGRYGSKRQIRVRAFREYRRGEIRPKASVLYGRGLKARGAWRDSIKD